MTNNQYNDFLQHYGVLGMKWGVRKDAYRKSKTLKAGTKVYRATVNKDEETSGPKYVTYLKVDRDNYRGDGGDWIRSQSGNIKNNLYENTYKLTKDVKIAGRDDIKKTFDKLEKNKKLQKEIGRAWVETKIVPDQSYDVYKKRLENLNNELSKKGRQTYEIKSEKGYRNMIEENRKKMLNIYMDNYSNMHRSEKFFTEAWAVGASKTIKSEVIKDLKKQGFQGMTDEASVGGKGKYGREGVDPLIIFDSNDRMEKLKTKKVSKYNRSMSSYRYNNWFNYANNYRRPYKDDDEW